MVLSTGTSYPKLDSNMANLSNHEFSISSTHKAASRSVAEPRPFTDAPNSNLCQTLNRRPHVPIIDACEHSGVGVRLLIITSRQLVAFEAGLVGETGSATEASLAAHQDRRPIISFNLKVRSGFPIQIGRVISFSPTHYILPIGIDSRHKPQRVVFYLGILWYQIWSEILCSFWV